MTKEKEQNEIPEEKKAHKTVKGKEIRIKEVELMTDSRNDQEVFKVKFHTEEGPTISYKPRINKKEHIKGMVKRVKKKPLIDDLPEKLLKIAEWVQKRTYCTVISSWHVWDKSLDDNEEGNDTFHYIDSRTSQWDDWKIDMSESEKVK